MIRLQFLQPFRLANTNSLVIVTCLFFSSLLAVTALADPPGKKAKKAKRALQAAAEEDGGFYGIMPSGDRVVFIIDNSNSMGARHRFDAAAAELVKAITYIP